MTDNDTLKRLLEISAQKWKNIMPMCYNHIDIKLYNKTASGAHNEQRLGMPAHDYYFSKAYEAIYEGTWKWDYQNYTIEEQLIRIINSMISEQVRKYKVEKKHNKQTILVENGQLNIFDKPENVEDYEENQLDKLSTALTIACQDNELYKRFIHLKKQDLDYPDICSQLNCTKNEAYRIREAISKSAKKILKSL